MKKIILYIFCICLLYNDAYASRFYGCTSTTGGGSGALDALDITAVSAPNTNNLSNGDGAIVVTSSGAYIYYFDSTATDAEASPDYVRPDDYATAGVWIRVVSGVTGDDYYSAAYINAYFHPIMSTVTQLQAEDLTNTTAYAYTPQRSGQTAYQLLEDYFGFRNALSSEPTGEWPGMVVLADNSSWDPASVAGTTPYWCICISAGSPGTWYALYDITGNWFLDIPLYVEIGAT
ncbi:MAG: hypothetical protein ACE5RH_00440, partial [Nitrosarchaeum sp.]